MKKTDKIFIAGGTGMVGSAIIRNLKEKGYNNIVASYHHRLPENQKESNESTNDIRFEKIDLLDGNSVKDFLHKEKPVWVVLAAAKVGGIMANNTYRAQFIYENLQIQNNIIHNSYLAGVEKLLFLGSSCIYPKDASQPLKEEYLLTSTLEYTNEPYAIAKIAGIKICESYNLQYGTNYISVMPTNLFGPYDNYDLEKSHVLPALIRKMHLGKCLKDSNWDAIRNDLNLNPIEKIDGKASENEIIDKLKKYGITKTGNEVKITLWGTGKPMREFLHSDDMADACVFIMENIDFDNKILAGVKGGIDQENLRPLPLEVRNTHINIGSGKDLTIAELSIMIQKVVGYTGNIVWDSEKPDGTFRKLMNVDKLHSLGWNEKYNLEDGLKHVYNHYLEQQRGCLKGKK